MANYAWTINSLGTKLGVEDVVTNAVSNPVDSPQLALAKAFTNDRIAAVAVNGVQLNAAGNDSESVQQIRIQLVPKAIVMDPE